MQLAKPRSNIILQSLWQKDDRANYYSLMVQMTINEYLDKIQSSFEKKGGLEGQRPRLIKMI